MLRGGCTARLRVWHVKWARAVSEERKKCVRRDAFLQHSSCRHPFYPFLSLARLLTKRTRQDASQIRFVSGGVAYARTHTLDKLPLALWQPTTQPGVQVVRPIVASNCLRSICTCRANWHHRSDEPGISVFRRRWRMERRSHADRSNLLPSIAGCEEHTRDWWGRIYVRRYWPGWQSPSVPYHLRRTRPLVFTKKNSKA
jgi:hypothetical protein